MWWRRRRRRRNDESEILINFRRANLAVLGLRQLELEARPFRRSAAPQRPLRSPSRRQRAVAASREKLGALLTRLRNRSGSRGRGPPSGRAMRE